MRGMQTGLLAGVSAAALFCAAGAHAQAADEPTTVEDIVVTAQKREQSLQSVPVAVTAYTGETMRELGVQSSADVARVVPNVEIGLPGGEGNQPLIYIRGVGLSDTSSNNAGPNGVYVDEVYVSSPGAQTFQIFDLERVEVLKGPQGTLYGRNATGGAINFISAKPRDEFTAQAMASYGSFNTLTGEAAVGGAINDAVRVRLAAAGARSDGYIRNELTGGRENGKGYFAVRGLMAVDFSDDLDALFSLHGGRVDVRAPQYRSLGVLDPATGAPCDAAAIRAGVCGNILGYVNPTSFYAGSYDRRERLEVENWGASARFNWTLGEITLTSITAYDYNDKIHREDTDASPLALMAIDYGVRSETFTQEVRLSGKGERTDWVAGAYYLHEDLKQNQTVDLFRELRFLTLGEGADPAGDFTGGAPVLFSRALNDQKTEAAALFGQIEYAILPELRATVGARYNYEKKQFSAVGQFEDAVIGGVAIPGGVLPLYAFDQSARFENASFKLGLDYDLAERVMVYGSVSTGFKSGGFNGGFLSFDPVEAARQAQPFDEETLIAYEAGLKSTLLEGRVRLNAAAFYYDYKDLQLYTLVNTGALPLQLLDNAANATIYGAEVELVAKPVQHLDVTMNLGLLDTKIEDFVSAGANFSGNRLALSPKVTFSGVASYEIPLRNTSAAVVLQSSVSYRSSQFFSADNDPLLSQDGYWLVGGRIALRSDDGRWEAAVFGRNLTAERYVNYAVDLSDFGFIEQNIGEPRMFGLEFKVAY
ncbi:TonB-dependent receptor [Phenylobacterium sp.]|uniref:TonB-dependent receptor n=1 Tax=Phenylobacterium sp. TaxID=1871053 RepID=UPI0035AEF282